MKCYIADTPGRLRIESPIIKGNTAEANKFRDFILAIPGVSAVDMKLIIGSATILYDTTKIDHTRLIEILDKSGDFDHCHAETPDDVLEEGIKKATEVVVEVLKDEV